MSYQVQRFVDVGGENREYWVYVPNLSPQNTEPPVMLFLHQEGAADPDLSEEQTRWSELAEQEGFVLVLPIGSGEAGQETWDYSGSQDIDFFLVLLKDLADIISYDPHRVYGSGIGLGAAMTHVLAATLSQKIAAIGTCSGGFIRPVQLASKPSRYVPVVMFHSQTDVFYPFGGGLGQDLFESPMQCSPIRDLVMFWVKNNYGPAVPEVSTHTGTVSLEQYGDIIETDRTKPVWLYLLADSGHTWPGQDLLDGVGGYVDLSIEATSLIWNFVSKFKLDQPHQMFDFKLHGKDEDHADSTEKLWRNKTIVTRAPRL